MTRIEAISDFKENIIPIIQITYEQDGEIDHIARSEEWLIYTDNLCENGIITREEESKWENPF